MGPTTMYEYAELIQKRMAKLEEQIKKEASRGEPEALISEECRELIDELLKEYYAAFDLFEFMAKNKPQ